MALTLAQILALPAQTRPRLIKASDRGGAIYQIEEGAAGSTATPVIPNNNDARAVMGLGSGDSVSFGALTVAGNALQVTGASAINQDLRTTASPTWAGGTFNAPSGFTGNIILGSLNGAQRFAVDQNGIVNATAYAAGTSQYYGFAARSKIYSPSDGQISFRNNANSADASLFFGGGTSSGPVTITDTTASTGPTTGGLTVAGGLGVGGQINSGAGITAAINGRIGISARGFFYATGDGNWVLRNNANNDFGSLSFRDATLSGSLTLPRTVIPPGTTGAQTINTATGKVRFAAGASTLVVTNSLATVNSIIFPNLDTSDITAKHAEITPANGSFTIRLNAAATAECTVSFGILTP